MHLQQVGFGRVVQVPPPIRPGFSAPLGPGSRGRGGPSPPSPPAPRVPSGGGVPAGGHWGGDLHSKGMRSEFIFGLRPFTSESQETFGLRPLLGSATFGLSPRYQRELAPLIRTCA